MHKIAVSGATGQLGTLVIENLKTRIPASEIVALARDPQKAAGLGVEARAMDYDQPGSLPPALKDVKTLLLISSNAIGRRSQQHRAVIDAAKAAGVERIVYTSLLKGEGSPLKLLAEEHGDTERALAASGLETTILRNGWYTENYTASIPGALAGGAFLGCAGTGRIASAARADYAEAAAVVLTQQGHAGRIYELAGDSAYTLEELAAEISRQCGRNIPYQNLSEAEYATALEGFGLPKPLAAAYAAFDRGAALGGLDDGDRHLSRLIGRPTTPLSVLVSAALKP
jgi:NAD(P)H dehydrogenase (quinone)